VDETPTVGTVASRVRHTEPDSPIVAPAAGGCIDATSSRGEPAAVRASTGRVLVVDDVDGNRTLVAALSTRDAAYDVMKAPC
jgi:hypothetical protein